MHYYQFNIGDYASHTSRLSMIEDLAYRRLIDLYYLNERPFNDCISTISRDVGLIDHSNEVAYVLSKYFIPVDEKWMHKRMDQEIRKYQRKSKSAKAAGKASGIARQLKASERTLNESSTSAEPTNNQEPITNNHKPIKRSVPKNKLDYSCWPQIPSEQVLNDWIAMRKKKKANITQTVINGFSKQLELAVNSGLTVDECITECVVRNWTGFKFDWMKPKSNVNDLDFNSTGWSQ